MGNDFPPKADSLRSEMELLVRSLTTEHVELLEIYQEIEAAVTKRKYGNVPRHATMLGDRLHEHMSLENLKLYSQIKRELDNAAQEKRHLVHSLQREMHTIGRSAIEFVRQLETTTINDANSERFSTSLRSVGATLVRRMRQEEDVLYPLCVDSVR